MNISNLRIESSHLRYNLSTQEISFDSNPDAARSTLTSPTQFAAANPTYSSGTRAPLMFGGTISGFQHSDMFLESGQDTFLSGGLEEDLQFAGAAHGALEWIAEQDTFQALSSGT